MTIESPIEHEKDKSGNGKPKDLPDLMKPAEHAKPTWLRVVYFAAGITCIILGIVFWLMPVITGLPFYPPALVFLALASDHVRQWLNKTDARLPAGWRLRIRRALSKVKSERFRRMFNFPEGLEQKRPGPDEEEAPRRQPPPKKTTVERPREDAERSEGRSPSSGSSPDEG